MAEKMTTILVHIPAETYEAVADICEAEERSMSSYGRVLIHADLRRRNVTRKASR